MIKTVLRRGARHARRWPAAAEHGAVRPYQLFDRHNGNSFGITEPINGEPATAGNGGTIGFKCTSLDQVKLFQDTAVAHGGTSIEQPPGLREGSLGAMHNIR